MPQERIELHKAEFRARHWEWDKKVPDLASLLQRLVAIKAYPEVVEQLQDSLTKDQFIDALEDCEVRDENLRVWSKYARWCDQLCSANGGHIQS